MYVSHRHVYSTHAHIDFRISNRVAYISHSLHTTADVITRCSIHSSLSYRIFAALSFSAIVCNLVCRCCSVNSIRWCCFSEQNDRKWHLATFLTSGFFPHFSDPYSHCIAIAFWLHWKWIYTYTYISIYVCTVYCVCVCLLALLRWQMMQIDGRTTTTTQFPLWKNVNEQKREAFRYGGAHSEALLKTEK